MRDDKMLSRGIEMKRRRFAGAICAGLACLGPADGSAAPVPAWLFGSGLIGLVGAARRGKRNDV